MANIVLHDTCIAGSWGLGFLLLPVAVVCGSASKFDPPSEEIMSMVCRADRRH